MGTAVRMEVLYQKAWTMCRIIGGQWSAPAIEPLDAQLETKEETMARLGEWTRSSPAPMVEGAWGKSGAEKRQQEQQERRRQAKWKRLVELGKFPLLHLEDHGGVIPGIDLAGVRGRFALQRSVTRKSCVSRPTGRWGWR